MTPDRCTAEIDVRFGPGIDPATAISQIAAVLLPRVSLRVTDFKPAVEEPPDSPFIATCAAAVTARTGRMPAIRGVSYYSDGAILLDGITAPFGILGPGDLGMSGQPDETASADAIRACTDIYVKIAEEWLA